MTVPSTRLKVYTDISFGSTSEDKTVVNIAHYDPGGLKSRKVEMWKTGNSLPGDWKQEDESSTGR